MKIYNLGLITVSVGPMTNVAKKSYKDLVMLVSPCSLRKGSGILRDEEWRIFSNGDKFIYIIPEKGQMLKKIILYSSVNLLKHLNLKTQ
jgi:hypothetical protein